MSFQNFDDDNEMISEINVTPLVDVMLVLLIIFILTMPLLAQMINIDLPHSNARTQPLSKQAIQIAVAKDGTIYWNDKIITPQEMKARFNNMTATNDHSEIQLSGDRHVDYGHIMTIMTAAEKSGIHRLGFVTAADVNQP